VRWVFMGEELEALVVFSEGIVVALLAQLILSEKQERTCSRSGPMSLVFTPAAASISE
jgi:hypothetical protein